MLDIESKVRHLSGVGANLEYLSCFWMQLLDSSLEGLHHLKRLDLSGCDFQHISGSFFKPLVNLESLVLWRPRNHSCLDLTHLVSLKWLRLEFFPSRLVETLESASSSLVVLEIRNSIESDNLDGFKRAIARLDKLKSLELTDYKLDHFDVEWIASSDLKRLSITSQQMRTINLNSNRMENLDQLDLGRNPMCEAIEPTVLARLKSLRTVILNKKNQANEQRLKSLCGDRVNIRFCWIFNFFLLCLIQ